jgi:hypothetical protein
MRGTAGHRADVTATVLRKPTAISSQRQARKLSNGVPAEVLTRRWRKDEMFTASSALVGDFIVVDEHIIAELRDVDAAGGRGDRPAAGAWDAGFPHAETAKPAGVLDGEGHAGSG